MAALTDDTLTSLLNTFSAGVRLWGKAWARIEPKDPDILGDIIRDFAPAHHLKRSFWARLTSQADQCK